MTTSKSGALFFSGLQLLISVFAVPLFSLPAKAQIDADVCKDFLKNREALYACRGFCTKYPHNARCRLLFNGKYERKTVEDSALPWSAIGTLKNEYGGHCSGTLVAPNLVLTAAHCLYLEKRRGGWYKLRSHELVFHAGPSDSNRPVKTSAIASIFIPPEYKPEEYSNFDYAFLTLSSELGAELNFINIYPLDEPILEKIVKSSWPVSQAGYGGHMAEQLSVHSNCLVTNDLGENAVFHNCDVLWGDSGSPLLIDFGDGNQILGVCSRITGYADDSEIKDLAVDARAFYQTYIELSNASFDPATQALADYQLTVKIDPDNASNHNNLGAALRAQDKLDDAIAAYRKALEIDPDFAVAHYNLGIALKAQNKFGEAIAAFQRTLELDPNFTGAQDNLTEVQRLFER